MSTAVTELIPESYPAYRESDSFYSETMLTKEHSQNVRHRYLPANLNRAGVVRGFFDSQDEENNYGELKHTTPSTTLENELGSVDLFDQYLAELEQMLAETKATFQSYERRIEELYKFALDDEECSEISESSKKDFWNFIKSMPWASKAGLMLLDNGNLSAVWRLAYDTRIEVEFFGGGWCNFVKLKRYGGANRTSHKVGVCSLDELSTELYE